MSSTEVIEFTEFPIKLAFHLGEVQPRVLFCNQIFLKMSAVDAFYFNKISFRRFLHNCTIKADTGMLVVCLLVCLFVFSLFPSGLVATFCPKWKVRNFDCPNGKQHIFLSLSCNTLCAASVA